MNNKYSYYPNSKYNRLDYNEFLNSLGINSNKNVSMNVNTNQNNQLFGSYEAYTRGNLFKNLYEQYKAYQPASLTPKSEQEEMMLNLNQMHFAMHEANLYLDNFPNDSRMMNEYVKYRDSYNKILNDYEQRYGTLNVNSEYQNRTPFAWEEEMWPWERRGL